MALLHDNQAGPASGHNGPFFPLAGDAEDQAAAVTRPDNVLEDQPPPVAGDVKPDEADPPEHPAPLGARREVLFVVGPGV